MKLSIIIPAHNEEGSLESTVRALVDKLRSERIDHEVLVINDGSKDGTEEILLRMEREIPSLKHVNNPPPNGFGLAVRCGLENFTGDAVAIYMADASDRPEDLVLYYRTLIEKNVDCVFGTRFSGGGKTVVVDCFSTS